MDPRNGYIIIEDVDTGDSKIEIPEEVGQPIRKGKILFTSVQAEEELKLNLYKDHPEKGLMIYYRAAEGHVFPDSDMIAIPYKAVIAIA